MITAGTKVRITSVVFLPIARHFRQYIGKTLILVEDHSMTDFMDGVLVQVEGEDGIAPFYVPERYVTMEMVEKARDDQLVDVVDLAEAHIAGGEYIMMEADGLHPLVANAFSEHPLPNMGVIFRWSDDMKTVEIFSTVERVIDHTGALKLERGGYVE